MGYERTTGVRVEPVGDGWAAFSPVSGETLLLNNEAAAVLEVLVDGASEPDAVCAALACDAGLTVEQVRAAMDDTWQSLLQAGLVRRVAVAG